MTNYKIELGQNPPSANEFVSVRTYMTRQDADRLPLRGVYLLREVPEVELSPNLETLATLLAEARQQLDAALDREHQNVKEIERHKARITTLSARLSKISEIADGEDS